MAYIYQIINDVNNKVYVGKTEFSLEKRFKEHCRDRNKESFKKRPLYRAMNKYGIEHFHIELIEETDMPEEREMYWIKKLNTYENGYNATIGGDGKRLLDYDLIISTYQQVQNIAEVARMLNIDSSNISNILKAKNIEIKSSDKVTKEKVQKAVGMYDLITNELIMSFPSTKDAARYLIQNKKTQSLNAGGISSHIVQVCLNKRKTAYSYRWKYLNQ